MSVEARCLALHSILLAFKAVLSSWSLVVTCALIARGSFKPELEVQAGISSYHALDRFENIGHAEVPEDYLYKYVWM